MNPIYIRLMLVLGTLVFLSACGKNSDSESSTSNTSPSEGEVLVTKNCKVCHAQGINGAPIIGNKKMWGPRTSQGLDTLAQHASEGYGLMPAKGGQTHLTDDQIKLAVEYMLSQVQ